MASPGRSVTPLLGSMSAEGLQELLAASLTLTPPPSNPDAQGMVPALDNHSLSDAVSQSVNQEVYSLWGQLAHLTKLQFFKNKTDKPVT